MECSEMRVITLIRVLKFKKLWELLVYITKVKNVDHKPKFNGKEVKERYCGNGQGGCGGGGCC